MLSYNGGEVKSMTILVCDDDKEIVEAISIYLKQEGYDVAAAYDGREALKIMQEKEVHLVILDIMMPKLDGIHALLKLREKSSIPVILLSAKSEDVDKILGLNVGADDYVTKPFNPLELVARVKTQLRRYTRYNNSPEFVEEKNESECDIRNLHIEKESHICLLNGKEVPLTPIEFSILWYLCERRGKVVPSEELFEAVWGEKYLDNNNTVMAHIARLREKLNEPARKPRFVKTVWGVGYKVE